MAEKSVFASVVMWLKETSGWIAENLGDPAIAATIREDLGLKPGQEIDDATIGRFGAFASDLDPDKEGFYETLDEIIDVIEALKNFGEAIKSDESGQTAWDVAYLIGRIAIVDSLRTRIPALHALGKLTLLISDDIGHVEEFDPAVVVGMLQGEGVPGGFGEKALQRWSAATWLGVVILERLLIKEFKVDDELLDFYYGWDLDPTADTSEEDLVSARVLTLLTGPPKSTPPPEPPEAEVTPQISVTICPLPREHSGPALFLSFGGSVDFEQKLESGSYRLAVNAAGALDVLIPFSDSDLAFAAGGDPQGHVALDYRRGDGTQPEVRIDGPGGTRLEVDKLRWALNLGADGASFGFGIEKARLIIALSEDGDGFLSSLGGELKLEFALGAVADTNGGFRLEGGTRARASLPVGTTLFDAFTVHNLDIELAPGAGEGFALKLCGGFGVHLGPFAVTVGGMGMALDAEIGDGNLGFLDVNPRFLPPQSLGLALDIGVVKGGGYLDVDAERGEYTGVLELQIGPVAVKALGILSTQLPDGSEGWSLLLLIFGTFPPAQLGLGFTLTGVGGLIGLQHGVSIPALESGLRTGTMDDILFPEDPVADAQRIINQLKTVYPVAPGALTFGPMLEIGWGTPTLVQLRMGLIAQLDNALGSANQGSIQFSRLVLIGRLLARLPAEETDAPALLKLMVDFLGYYDATQKRLGFQARLREDSFLGQPLKLALSGMVFVQAQFGESASFVLAAGGFHPRFKDLPAGVPSKIARLSVKFKIKIVKLTLEAYFAIAPGAVQTGAQVLAKAKIGPVSLEGWLGFDAIFYDSPHFHFEVDLRAGVTVKFKGRTLAGVTLNMTLSGPGQWRAKGSIKFSVLFWDVKKSFNKSVGSAVTVGQQATNVAALVQAALSEPGNWEAQLPAGGVAAVTLGAIRGVDGLLAHPNGSLTIIQNVAPLGLRLKRFGNTKVAGADRFDIEQVSIGGSPASAPTPVQAPFAMSQFLNLTEEQKLTASSFEKAKAGMAVATDDYSLSNHEVAADLDFETHYLRTDNRGQGDLVIADLEFSFLDDEFLEWQGGLGAAGRTPLRQEELLRSDADSGFLVADAPLAMADPNSMSAAGAKLEGDAVSSVAFAAQSAPISSGDFQLVEAFELAENGG